MINFVVTDHQAQARRLKLRRTVFGVTTTILAGYIVLSAGFIGWLGYLESLGRNIGQEIFDLKGKVVGRAKTEILIRKIDERASGVKAFTDSKPTLHEIGIKLSEGLLMPEEWDYDLEKGKQSVTFRAVEPDLVGEYQNYLVGLFDFVRLESLTWDKGQEWKGIMSFSNLKKEKR